MATEVRKRTRTPHRDRVPYRFTADEVFRLIEAGIITDHIELWDGVIYKVTKKELHNVLVGQVADAFRPMVPAGFHVREEKSCQDGEYSLPEPDVTVVRGGRRDYLPDVPPLSRMALVVEVSHHSAKDDRETRLKRYAEVGLPVYWIVEVKRRVIDVYERPKGRAYKQKTTYAPGQVMPVVLDGREVGRNAVADLFPPPG
jgi:Uma2 family endonuclease